MGQSQALMWCEYQLRPKGNASAWYNLVGLLYVRNIVLIMSFIFHEGKVKLQMFSIHLEYLNISSVF